MPIVRLNHAVLYVGDLARSVSFYEEVLGFVAIHGTLRALEGKAAFLRAQGSTNDHDLGLFAIAERADPLEAGDRAVGLYHLAWEVDTLAELERLAGELTRADALTGTSDHGATKSLYGRDPDGLAFEIAWVVPAALLDDEALAARSRIKRLDLAREIQRYGAQTQGGIGVSR